MERREDVPAWVWSTVQDEFSGRLGAAEWDALRRDADGGSGAEVLSRLVQMAEKGHAHAPPLGYDLGRRLAREWGVFYEPVVEGLRGAAARMLVLLAEEILPTLIGSRARMVRMGDAGATLAFEGKPPASLQRGLLEGFLALCGAEATTRAAAGGALSVSWRLKEEPPGVGRLAVLATSIRFPFFVATIVPIFVALAIAAREGPLDVLGAALTLVGVLSFQLGSNALNDFYEVRSGEAHAVSETARRAPAAWLRWNAYALYAFGSALGLLLVVRVGIEVLWLGLAGFLLGFLYTAPPVRLAYRGLGELAVAVGFGPLIVLGAYFVQRQDWSVSALLASIPLAFLIAGVLYLHELPDRAGDARVGKRTLIVRLPERPALVVYVLLQAMTYILILAGVALAGVPSLSEYAFPAWSLLGLVTLPLATRATLVLARNYRFPYRLLPTNATAVRLNLVTGTLFAAGYAVALLP